MNKTTPAVDFYHSIYSSSLDQVVVITGWLVAESIGTIGILIFLRAKQELRKFNLLDLSQEIGFLYSLIFILIYGNLSILRFWLGPLPDWLCTVSVFVRNMCERAFRLLLIQEILIRVMYLYKWKDMCSINDEFIARFLLILQFALPTWFNLVLLQANDLFLDQKVGRQMLCTVPSFHPTSFQFAICVGRETAVVRENYPPVIFPTDQRIPHMEYFLFIPVVIVSAILIFRKKHVLNKPFLLIENSGGGSFKASFIYFVCAHVGGVPYALMKHVPSQDMLNQWPYSLTNSLSDLFAPNITIMIYMYYIYRCRINFRQAVTRVCKDLMSPFPFTSSSPSSSPPYPLTQF